MSEFIIRPVGDADELFAYRKLATRLFRYADRDMTDEDAYRAKLEKELATLPSDMILLGAFEDGVFRAGMHLVPFSVHFRGESCGMCGIGNVISDPAVSGRGAVKNLFREAFRIMRDQGRPLSHLYPFQMGYYRRYGYEVSCATSTWDVPVEYFITRGEGRIVPYDGSSAMRAEVRRIYEGFARRYDFSILKTDEHWKSFFDKYAPCVTDQLSYFHETDGKFDAFMTYHMQPNADRPQDLIVTNAWFTSLAGLRGLFGQFKTQIPYADRVKLPLPENIDISAMIECDGGWGKRNSDFTTAFRGLSRAVDAEALLRRSISTPGGAPREAVSLRIVGDDYCPWNNGLYRVSGNEVVKTDDTTALADVELTPNAFAALFFGRYGIDSCSFLPGVTLNRNAEGLRTLFAPHTCFIDMHF